MLLEGGGGDRNKCDLVVPSGKKQCGYSAQQAKDCLEKWS